MRINLDMVGTPAERIAVADATVSQLRQLLYAVAELGNMHASLTLEASLYPQPNAGQHANYPPAPGGFE